MLYSNGTLTDLGTLGGTASRAAGINARGQIVGDSYLNGNTVDHAFLYSNGVMSDLGTLGGSNSSAVAINDLGQVVGSSQTLGHNDSSSGFEGFIYNSGVLKDIESTIGTSGFPQAINDTGQMSVDVAVNASTDTYHAFLYNGTALIDLGTLGGRTSSGSAINNSGQIVGIADTLSSTHAFIYSGGKMTDLGTLGGTTSNAQDINAAGQIVGNSQIPIPGGFAPRAFLYSGATKYELNGMLDSSGAGWAVQSASGINDDGWIAAKAELGDVYHAVLLTPVPPVLLRGDFNQDGLVTAADASAMMNALANLEFYKARTGLSDSDLLANADINGDGAITNADLQAFLNQLKSGGGSPAAVPVPEPASIAVTAMGAVALGIALFGKCRPRI